MTALSSSAAAPALVGMNLNDLGIDPAQIHANLSPAELVELAVRRGEGQLTDSGALNAFTGSRTGRSPRDRFIVPEPSRNDDISWGSINQKMESGRFDRLMERVREHFGGRQLFVFDGAACADSAYRLS